MTTFLIISLSILSGIYLERGRKWIIQNRRFKSMRDRIVLGSEYLNLMAEHDQKRRQWAMEDRLGKTYTLYGVKFDPEKDTLCGETLTENLQDQLKDALEHEEFERAAGIEG